jgi:putative transposase
MPAKNIRKLFVPQTYYHLYNRGVNKELIYRDDADYRVFLNLIKRILSPIPHIDNYGRQFTNLSGQIELNAFCLMPNHFHLLVYQDSVDGITKFMRSLSTAYAMYFNKKYTLIGHKFQSAYRASLIDSEIYFQYISHYIHLNPSDYTAWRYSSLSCYLEKRNADWLNVDRILQPLGGSKEYARRIAELSIEKNFVCNIADVLEPPIGISA